MSRLARDFSLVKEIRKNAFASYAGPALAHTPQQFSSDDVYQISDREFYSWSDDLRYYLSDTDKRVALIPLKGLLMCDSWGDDYQYIVDQIKQSENEAYAGTLIIADSPGGMTKGMRKLNAAIAAYSKPIGVWVSGNLNSAAAYVTAPADFIYADPLEENSFGSIGVWCMHVNESKRLEKSGTLVKITRNEGADLKAKPNEFEEWTEEDMQRVQDSVNADAADFHTVMVAQRGLSPAQLSAVKLGGEFGSQEAFAQGLHDGTATMEEAINAVSEFQSTLFL